MQPVPITLQSVHVWYASYGSNVLQERFLTYLRGGPVPITGKIQHGARNAADPLDDRPFHIDRLLMFGGQSKSWNGGGVAFVDPHTVVEGGTMGRAWLVTVDQLADVWAQENGETVGPPIDLGALVGTGSADLGRGWYRRLEFLGHIDGAPVITITCETPPPANAGGSAYLEVVGRGVMSTWGTSPAETAGYLAVRSGNHGVVDQHRLTELLKSDPLRQR